MTKEITLIFPSSPFLIDPLVFPPLGIMYLSSFLKLNGIDTTLIDLSGYKELPEIKTEWVGISSTTPQWGETLKIRDKLKGRGHKVGVGGPHIRAQKVFDFDFHIFGEGELSLLETLRSEGNINYIYHKPIEDIDKIPFPDREGGHVENYHYDIDGDRTTTMITSRGCPFSCSFCSSIWGKNVRFRSPEDVYEEIKEVKEKYGFSSVMFFDDIFAINKNRVKKIADLVEPLEMKFRGFSRVDTADKELLLDLVRMGFVELGIGVESGSQKLLDINSKGVKIEQCESFIEMAHDVGLRVKAFFIIGLPGETHDTIKDTMNFLERNKLDDIDVTLLQPYPGSDIWNNTEKYDIKFDKEDLKDCFFKGRPGEYNARVSTDCLSSRDLEIFRNLIEHTYKGS